MTPIRNVANWRSAGACLSADPDLFFPISATGPAQRQIARAKLICARCVVRQECLEFAMSHDQVYGIWGGTTPEDRQRDRRRKRRAATAAAKRAVSVLSRLSRRVIPRRPATAARASAPCRPGARRCRRAW